MVEFDVTDSPALCCAHLAGVFEDTSSASHQCPRSAFRSTEQSPDRTHPHKNAAQRSDLALRRGARLSDPRPCGVHRLAASRHVKIRRPNHWSIRHSPGPPPRRARRSRIDVGTTPASARMAPHAGHIAGARVAHRHPTQKTVFSPSTSHCRSGEVVWRLTRRNPRRLSRRSIEPSESATPGMTCTNC